MPQVVNKIRGEDPGRGPGAKLLTLVLERNTSVAQVIPPHFDLVDRDPMLWCASPAIPCSVDSMSGGPRFHVVP